MLTATAIRSLSCRRIIVSKCPFHTSPCTQTFWVRDEKEGYNANSKLPPLKERILGGFKELKKEFVLCGQELQDNFYCTNQPLTIRPGEIDVQWKFGNEDSLENWVTTSDSDHNEGFSNCRLSLTKSGNGLFSGELCRTVPKDGRLARSGYCNMRTKTFRKSFKRQVPLDWNQYNILNMRVRGDGRSYFLNIGTKGYFDVSWHDMYHYILFTRGGPYWQEVRIPFSKFIFSSRGRIQDKQSEINLSKISSFAITLADKVNGSFALEIEYIGVEYDPYHTEKFAYEMYETENNIAST